MRSVRDKQARIANNVPSWIVKRLGCPVEARSGYRLSIAGVDHITSRSRGKDGPGDDCASDGSGYSTPPHPQPHPPRHWAEASVAVTANVAATVAAARI